MSKFALISQILSKFCIFVSFLHFFCLMWLDWDVFFWFFKELDRTNSNNFCEKSYVVKWDNIVLNSMVTMNSHTLPMETHWIVPIRASSEYVYVLDCSLKVSVSQLKVFKMSPWPFDLLFGLNNNFQMKKCNV